MKLLFGRSGRELHVDRIKTITTDFHESEPGILKVFEQIWETNDLIASFDGMNISFPVNPETGRTDIEPTSESVQLVQKPESKR